MSKIRKWGEYIPHKNDIEKDIILVDYCKPNVTECIKCYFLGMGEYLGVGKHFGYVKIKDKLFLDTASLKPKKGYSYIYHHTKKEFNEFQFLYSCTKLVNIYSTDKTGKPKINDKFINARPTNKNSKYVALFVNKFIRCYDLERVTKHPLLKESI